MAVLEQVGAGVCGRVMGSAEEGLGSREWVYRVAAAVVAAMLLATMV